jgi:hypothetical protein
VRSDPHTIFRAALDLDHASELGRDAVADKLSDSPAMQRLRRARGGVDEPRLHDGEGCGYVRKHSDRLLIFLLKARRPAKYQGWVVAKRKRSRPAQSQFRGLC